MRIYELVLVLRPSLKEDDRKKLLTTIKTWIKDVKITKEEDWGSKALKYPIKKELTGFYYDFILEADKITEDLEKKLLTQENVLRHLLIRKK